MLQLQSPCAHANLMHLYCPADVVEWLVARLGSERLCLFFRREHAWLLCQFRDPVVIVSMCRASPRSSPQRSL